MVPSKQEIGKTHEGRTTPTECANAQNTVSFSRPRALTGDLATDADLAEISFPLLSKSGKTLGSSRYIIFYYRTAEA